MHSNFLHGSITWAVNLFRMGSSCSVPALSTRPGAGLAGVGLVDFGDAVATEAGGGELDVGGATAICLAGGGPGGGATPISSPEVGAGASIPAKMASQLCNFVVTGASDGVAEGDCMEVEGFLKPRKKVKMLQRSRGQ